jgi:hypothetical protein
MNVDEAAGRQGAARDRRRGVGGSLMSPRCLRFALSSIPAVAATVVDSRRRNRAPNTTARQLGFTAGAALPAEFPAN